MNFYIFTNNIIEKIMFIVKDMLVNMIKHVKVKIELLHRINSSCFAAVLYTIINTIDKYITIC